MSVHNPDGPQQSAKHSERDPDARCPECGASAALCLEAASAIEAEPKSAALLQELRARGVRIRGLNRPFQAPTQGDPAP